MTTKISTPFRQSLNTRNDPGPEMCRVIFQYITRKKPHKVSEFIRQVSLRFTVFIDWITVVCTENTNYSTNNKEWRFDACTWMEGRLSICSSTICTMSNISEETLPDKGSSRQLPFFKTISSSRQPAQEIKEVLSLPAGQKINIVCRKRLHLRLHIKFQGIL